MNEAKPLTPKQDSFCVHYTTIGAETYSNGTKSAIAAGYSEKGAYARASELLRNRKVLERVSELHTENMQRNQITVDKVLADLEHDKLKAREAGQYSVSYQCTVAQGKHLAMFTDRSLIGSDEQQRQLTEAQRKTFREFGEYIMQKRLAASETDTQPVVEPAAEPAQQAQSS
jgi:phage terminase small subunit